MYKQIIAYPNYSISEMGIVCNNKTGHTLKAVDNGKGYKVVKLFNEHRPNGRLCLVHRLVLSTFNPLPVQDLDSLEVTTSLDVNHIDGDKANNILANLEWVTKSENTRHAHLTGLFKNKLTIDQVKEIKRLKEETERDTQQYIADMYGVSRSIIGKIWNNKLYDYV